MAKQKYMENGKQTKEKCNRINNRDTEKVNKFEYLGYNFTNNNIISFPINRYINKGKKCHYGLPNLLCFKAITERYTR
jgi:hypothetical protein